MDVLDLLTGDARAFLAEAWASRTHIHKADPSDVVGLLSLDDVDGLVTSSALRAPALRVAQDGKVLPTSAFTRQATIAGAPLTGLVDARKVAELFDSGATLVLQGLHRYWPPLTRVVRDLEGGLGHPCQANAYLTPPGAQGFALHSDTHDVFVFQTYGAKQWEIHDRGTVLDVSMEPGTCMYLPAGTPHAARTQDTASLHVTVGLNQLGYRDTLRRIVDEVLDGPEFADRIPARYVDDPTPLADGLASRLRTLADRLAEVDAAGAATDQVVRFLSSRAPQLRGRLRDTLLVATVEDDTEVARRPGSVCVVRHLDNRPEQVTLLLGDRQVHLPGRLTDVAEYLAGIAPGAYFRPRDLTPWLDQQSRQVLVRRLVREGLLSVDG